MEIEGQALEKRARIHWECSKEPFGKAPDLGRGVGRAGLGAPKQLRRRVGVFSTRPAVTRARLTNAAECLVPPPADAFAHRPFLGSPLEYKPFPSFDCIDRSLSRLIFTLARSLSATIKISETDHRVRKGKIKRKAHTKINTQRRKDLASRQLIYIRVRIRLDWLAIHQQRISVRRLFGVSTQTGF